MDKKAKPKLYNHETASVMIPNPLAEQAEQEPVAWIEIERGIPMFVRFADKYKPNCDGFIPLYAAPVRTKDLTDDEIEWLVVDTLETWNSKDTMKDFARAVIAADREKNK